MTRNILIFSAVLFSAGLSGCVEQSVPSEPLDIESASLPIINGEPPDAPRHNAVVAILISTRRGTYICSGSLVTPDVVVTAAHCTDVEFRPKPQFQTASPSDLRVFLGDDLSTAVQYAVSEVVIHEGYNRASYGVNDISLIRLSQPVPACGDALAFPDCADPVAALPGDPGFSLNEDDVGAVDGIDFAGFGVTAVDGNAGVKMHVFGTVGGFGCAVSGCSNPGDPDTQFSYVQVFDNPDPTGEDGQGVCFGDSGGPAFVERSGVWYTAGVTSYGDSTCSEYGVSMRVDAYETFISNFIGVPECAVDTDCDDGSECTLDTCDAGACAHVPAADDSVCAGGICCAGVCAAPDCASDAECDDGDSCTSDTCVSGGTCDAVCQSDWPTCGLDDGCCGEVCTAETDPDCEAAPVCAFNKELCDSNADCCSGVCINGRCRGN